MASDQEKQKMQNDFAAATMDLLAHDVNASNSHTYGNATMRLSAIFAGDGGTSVGVEGIRTSNARSSADGRAIKIHQYARCPINLQVVEWVVVV